MDQLLEEIDLVIKYFPAKSYLEPKASLVNFTKAFKGELMPILLKYIN